MNVRMIELDLGKSASGQMVTIGQGDSGGTTIEARIYDDGAPLDLSGCEVSLVALLPDRKHYARQVCEVSGGSAVCVVDESHFAAVAGYTDEAYLTVKRDTSICSTQRFALDIMRSALDGQSPAENWDDEIDELVREGSRAVAGADAAASKADSAAGRAASAAEAATRSSSAADAAAKSATTAAASANVAAPKATAAASAADKATTAANAAETERSEAETGRVTAETGRVEAEAERAKEMQDLVGMVVPPIEDAVIDKVAEGGSETGPEALTTTGLTHLWAKIKALFAPIAHKHVAADISDAIPTSKIADGAVTGPKIPVGTIGTGHVAPKAVTGDKIAPNSVDSAQLTQAVRDSISQIRAGERVEVRYYGAGFITGAGTSAVITLMLDRRISASRCSITGYLIMRQCNRYVFGAADKKTAAPPATAQISGNAIIVTFNKSDGYAGCVNNDAVGVQFDGSAAFA